MESLFVSIKEAASLVGCSQDLIRDLIAKGDLPAARIGTARGGVRGVWRIRRDALVALFSGGRVA
jgi:excisionase family DNA binding protein